MKIIELLKQNMEKTWKWVAIICFCLFFLQTCSKCSSKQNHAFAEKDCIETIDNQKDNINQLQDSILVLHGQIQTCNKSNQDLQNENSHLRDALKQSQSKPVIIYKENSK